MKKIFIICVVLLSVSALKAQTGWNKIGETSVDFQTQKGVVNFPSTDTFKALRIKTDAPVHIESLSIVYQDGSPEIIPVRYDFKANVESRDINIQGTKRKIKEVDFVYKQVPNTKTSKATVEVSGSK